MYIKDAKGRRAFAASKERIKTMPWNFSRISYDAPAQDADSSPGTTDIGAGITVQAKPVLTVEGFWRAAGLGEYRALTEKQIKIAGGF